MFFKKSVGFNEVSTIIAYTNSRANLTKIPVTEKNVIQILWVCFYYFGFYGYIFSYYSSDTI